MTRDGPVTCAWIHHTLARRVRASWLRSLVDSTLLLPSNSPETVRSVGVTRFRPGKRLAWFLGLWLMLPASEECF